VPLRQSRQGHGMALRRRVRKLRATLQLPLPGSRENWKYPESGELLRLSLRK